MNELLEGLARVMRLTDAGKLEQANMMLRVVMLMGCTPDFALSVLLSGRVERLAAFRGQA